MNRKILVVLLAVTLFSGAVMLGVHLMHKDALADVTYTVQVRALVDDDPETWVDAIGHNVRFTMDGNPFVRQTDGLGIATYVAPAAPTNPWEVEMVVEDFTYYEEEDMESDTYNPPLVRPVSTQTAELFVEAENGR